MALKQDLGDAVQRLNALHAGDGDAVGAMASAHVRQERPMTFGLLGKNPTPGTCSSCCGASGARGVDGLADFAGRALNLRRWADRDLGHDFSRAMIAPWVLHSGMGPDDAATP